MEPTINVKEKFKELYTICDEIEAKVEEYSNKSFIGKAISWLKNPQNKLMSQVDKIYTEVKKLNGEDGFDEYQKTSVSRGTQNILNSFEAIRSKIPADSSLPKLNEKLVEVSGIITEFVPRPEEVGIVTIEPIKTIELISDAHAQLNETYESDGSGNIDYGFVDPERCFAYVADGMGHNKPDIKPIQTPLFEAFNDYYANRLKSTALSSVEEMKLFLEKHLKDLARTIYDSPLVDRSPAFSFVQVIEDSGQKYLLTAQLADCMILVRHADGRNEAIYTGKNEVGLGGRPMFGRGFSFPNVNIHEIESGTEVFGFSDGVADFMTLDQLNCFIDSNTDRNLLLDELKAFIIESGTQFDNDHGLYEDHGLDEETLIREKKNKRRNPTEDQVSANGEKKVKYWMSGSSEFYDDISSFSFKVS
ncbi:MAG: hypothetical protein K940chlam3_01148 [Chlamydiae bacterium]|nr:hypothetical protein [Chlamydiota bacterium]